MDVSAGVDGVYIGNYVLVDYDTELSADWGVICYAYAHVNENYYQPYPDGAITEANFSSYVDNDNFYVYDVENEQYVHPLIFSDTAKYYQYIDIDSEEDGSIELWTAEKGVQGAHRIKYTEAIVSKNIYPRISTSQETYFRYFLVKGNQVTTNAEGISTVVVYNHINGNDGILKDTIFEVYDHIGDSQ
jgi:hypothetical protein